MRRMEGEIAGPRGQRGRRRIPFAESAQVKTSDTFVRSIFDLEFEGLPNWESGARRGRVGGGFHAAAAEDEEAAEVPMQAAGALLAELGGGVDERAAELGEAVLEVELRGDDVDRARPCAARRDRAFR